MFRLVFIFEDFCVFCLWIRKKLSKIQMVSPTWFKFVIQVIYRVFRSFPNILSATRVVDNLKMVFLKAR